MRNLNTQLRTLTEWAPSHDQDCSYNFFCECGCTEPVPLTVAEYDTLEGASVYLPGHTPLEKRYGVVIRPSDEAA